jgi:hypothetical protein
MRWYRRALSTGDLQITEYYGSGWLLVLAAIGPLAFVAVPVVFLVRLSSWDVADRLPAETWVLAWAVLAAFLLMTVLFAAPLLVLMVRMILSQRVLRAEFSAGGICATLSTGHEVSYPWTELVSIPVLGGYAQARFRDGRSLWFSLRPPHSRTVTVLRACRDRFLPEEAARQRRAEHRSYLRIAVWCLLGSLLAGLLTTLYGIDDGSRLSGHALAGLMLLASGILVVFLSWRDRFSRWDHRRARRAARRRRRQRSRNAS